MSSVADDTKNEVDNLWGETNAWDQEHQVDTTESVIEPSDDTDLWPSHWGSKPEPCLLWEMGPEPPLDTRQFDWDLINNPPPPPPPKEATLIDTIEMLDAFLPILSKIKHGVPELGCDGEGGASGFGRDGVMTFLSITIFSLDETYIFDTQVLGREVFDRTGADGLSLRQILESPTIIQVWWDVRQDWDALFHLYGVVPGKIRDLQLLELLSCNRSRNYISGLAGVMEYEGRYFMGKEELANWLDDKWEGKFYFNSVGYGALEERPLKDFVKSYVAGDTDTLGLLHTHLHSKLRKWARKWEIDSVDDLMEFIDQQSTLRAQLAVSIDRPRNTYEVTAPPEAFRGIYNWEVERAHGLDAGKCPVFKFLEKGGREMAPKL